MDSFPDPVFAPEPGWTELPIPQSRGSGIRFVSGDASGTRLRVRYYHRAEDSALVGRAWFGPDTEGPPGYAHGGSISALLDEAMGLCSWIAGHGVVAVRLTVNFRELLPLGTTATFEAWIDNIDGRKVTGKGRIYGPDGTHYGDSEGLFIKLAPKHLERIDTGQMTQRLNEESDDAPA